MTFRLLQIGLGNRGGMWADIVAGKPDVEITGVMDLDPARIEAFAARHPGPRRFTSLDAALQAGGYDAALLVTPPDGHLEQSRAIFAAGLPLLAEKPLATTLEDSAAIVRLAEAHGLPLTVGLNFRYLPVTQAYRDLVARDACGAPGFGQFSYRRNRDGRRPGLNRYPLTMRHPMMLEQSVHHLDLIRFVYGREVEAIACRTWNPAWSMYAHAANVSCLLTLEGGLEVNYFGTWSGGWNTPGFEWRTDCAQGVVVQRELFSDLTMAATGEENLTPVPIADERAFYDDTAHLLDAFIAAMKDGTPPPCDGRDHLRTLALCFAGIESDETGQRIDVSDYMVRNGLSDLMGPPA
jgi:predicted dehydrogenase